MDDALPLLSLPVLGGTAGLAAVMLLDAEPHPRAGIPSAISTGMGQSRETSFRTALGAANAGAGVAAVPIPGGAMLSTTVVF